MELPNSDIEIRPTLSSYNFYIGQTGKPEHNPLYNFDLLYGGAELGFSFTLSGLNRVNNPYDSENKISILIMYYIKNGQVGFKLNNMWTIDLDEKQMQNTHENFQFTITKTYLEFEQKEYDMYNTYPLLKIIAFPKKINLEEINENILSQWMTWNQTGELLNVKIPMFPERNV